MHSLRKHNFDPALPGPKRQRAALCYQQSLSGRQVLLVTSRGSGRWITPKGRPLRGMPDHQTTVQEAWKEAGVMNADVGDNPIGDFIYIKGMNNGRVVPVKADVYLKRVTKLARTFPVAHERKRIWVNRAEASAHVTEPQLQHLFKGLDHLSNIKAPPHNRFLRV